MGNNNCCWNKENFLNHVANEKQLSESIEIEKSFLKNQINKNNKNVRDELSKTNLNHKEYYSNTSERLKDIVSKLETNFYLLTLHDILNGFQERFAHQRFKNFITIKQAYVTFIKRFRFEFNYKCLIIESQKLNEFLDYHLDIYI